MIEPTDENKRILAEIVYVIRRRSGIGDGFDEHQQSLGYRKDRDTFDMTFTYGFARAVAKLFGDELDKAGWPEKLAIP